MPIQDEYTPSSHFPDKLPIKTELGPQGSPTPDKPKSGGPTRGDPPKVKSEPKKPKQPVMRGG
jgi:hypothetical protein